MVGTTPPPPLASASSRSPAVLPPKKKKGGPSVAAPAPVPAAYAAPVGGSVRGPRGEEIELPLAPVIAGLPLELRAKLMTPLPANRTILLQAEVVISQLAFGAVKISFGELRQLAPGVFVNSGGDLDNKLISLPLHEILPRVNPALLARRSAKKVEVTDEIVGPFSERGRGFTFTTQPLKNAPPAQPSAPASAQAPAPISFSPPAAARHASPPPPAPKMVSPVNGGNGHGHPPVSPMSPPRSVTPAGGGSHGALPPGVRLNGRTDASAPAPAPIRMAPSQGATPVPAPKPAPGAAIFAALRDLCESWPEAIKSEVMDGPLGQVSVPLDSAVILPGLKRGRVVMTWKQIRQLAQPGSGPSANDNLELELPLKVIAPMFMAAQKGAVRPQTKATVSTEIPDLFYGFPKPGAAAPAADPAPAAAPAPAPAPAPVPSAPVIPVVPPLPQMQMEQMQADTNFYSWTEKGETPGEETRETDFLNRQTHPKDVVAQAAALPGVAGAVVGMQDGLRVASQVPTDLNPDTLAAFLPQIFERVNQSTRELRMGALNNISFTVGKVPWRIYRVNAVYFAIFGRPAEPLPSAKLAQLAAQLDRKKPQ